MEISVYVRPERHRGNPGLNVPGRSTCVRVANAALSPLLLIAINTLFGCGIVHPTPIEQPKFFVAENKAHQGLTMLACAENPHGDILAVYVSITSYSADQWSLVLGQFLAESPDGVMAAIPPEEAERERSVKQVATGVEGGATSAGKAGGIGVAFGAAMGAAIATAEGGAGSAALGAGLGGAVVGGPAGIIGGILGGVVAYYEGVKEPTEQVKDISLSESKEVKLYYGSAVTGYVYFPKHQYAEVTAILVKAETTKDGQSQSANSPMRACTAKVKLIGQCTPGTPGIPICASPKSLTPATVSAVAHAAAATINAVAQAAAAAQTAALQAEKAAADAKSDAHNAEASAKAGKKAEAAGASERATKDAAFAYSTLAIAQTKAGEARTKAGGANDPVLNNLIQTADAEVGKAAKFAAAAELDAARAQQAPPAD